MRNWFEYKDDILFLQIYVQPGAKKSEIVGLHGEPPRIKIKVQAKPTDGEANRACIEFVAKSLSVPKSCVIIIAGHKSRLKQLKVLHSVSQHKLDEWLKT